MKRLPMCLGIAAAVVLAGCSSSKTSTAPSTATTNASGATTAPCATVTLSPGQTASATLGIVDAGNFPGDCQRTPVSGLQSTPPGQTASLVIAHADTACANPQYSTLHVGPFASA